MMVPGSKSYTHRVLVAAALSDGRCLIDNALDSEDTHLTLRHAEALGRRGRQEGTSLAVSGRKGALEGLPSPIFLGNSGTSMRLLTAVAALALGRSLLTGTDRLQARPIRDLLDGLARVGVGARSLGPTDARRSRSRGEGWRRRRRPELRPQQPVPFRAAARSGRLRAKDWRCA